MLVRVHVTHRDQRAVLRGQTGGVVGAGVYAGRRGGFGNQSPEFRVALVGKGQVLDEMR